MKRYLFTLKPSPMFWREAPLRVPNIVITAKTFREAWTVAVNFWAAANICRISYIELEEGVELEFPGVYTKGMW